LESFRTQYKKAKKLGLAILEKFGAKLKILSIYISVRILQLPIGKLQLPVPSPSPTTFPIYDGAA